MGTHPIFESDFDCLTDGKVVMPSLLEVAKSNPFNRPQANSADGLVEFGSTKYYLKCMIGGAASCGITHTAVVPLDLVKCRMQVDSVKYPSLGTGFKVTLAEGGAKALARGWAPTLIGYSMQGTCKFGFYEIFKNLYANAMGEENAYVYRTSLYLIASASAEFFADIALCPMEAVKVRIQTSDYVSTLRECFPKMKAEEGTGTFFKGLKPLWMRQIPYTMMKFACFEKTVVALYDYVVPKPRDQCSKSEQLMVTFAAGYIAGVFCAIVSHPADSVVSVINKNPGKSAGEILKELGHWSACTKGLPARIIMIGTLTALQWFIYDGVKVALRLPRPPPPQMPESLRLKLEAQNK